MPTYHFVILNTHNYHYEVIETIINKLAWICHLDTLNYNPLDKCEAITIVSQKNEQFMHYISSKYININYILLDTNYETDIDNVINPLIAKPDTTVYIINTTYYEMQQCLDNLRDRRRLRVEVNMGKYSQYYPLDKFKHIKYYYVIHDLIKYLDNAHTSHKIDDNIICMTPMQETAMKYIRPRIMPCLHLPFTTDYETFIKTRFDMGYPIILIQGNANRRYLLLLRNVLDNIKKLYPNIPKFEIYILSNKLHRKSQLRHDKYKSILKIETYDGFVDYHTAISKCWAIMPLVSPQTQPRYYASEHINKLNIPPHKPYGCSLTSSINYGEAYRQIFIIESDLYSIYANDKWPWLSDKSYIYKCNNLDMPDKVEELAAAINNAVLLYYDQHDCYINIDSHEDSDIDSTYSDG